MLSVNHFFEHYYFAQHLVIVSYCMATGVDYLLIVLAQFWAITGVESKQ